MSGQSFLMSRSHDRAMAQKRSTKYIFLCVKKMVLKPFNVIFLLLHVVHMFKNVSIKFFTSQKSTFIMSASDLVWALQGEKVKLCCVPLHMI